MLMVNQLIGFGAFPSASFPTYRYYRFSFTTNTGGPSGILVGEFRLFSDVLTTDISPTMTSNSAPSPYATSASHEISSGGYGPAWEASNLTQNTSGDGWLSTTTVCWWKIDFGSGVVVRSYSMTNSDEGSRFPANWIFEGSNDNSAWTTLDTQSGITWASNGLTKQFSLP